MRCLQLKVLFICVFFVFGVSELRAEPQGRISLLEAVRFTISKQPNILLQEQQVEIARGEGQVATGQFDYMIGASLGLDHGDTPFFVTQEQGYGVEAKQLDTAFGTVNIKKQFRSGITVGPELEMTHTRPEIESLDGPDNSQSSFNFVITIPLLKGAGIEAAGAQEKAARKGYEAAVLDLRHTTSLNVLETVSTYWNYMAAKHRLEILQKAEKRANGLVVNTQALIQEDEVPASEIETALANQANKTGNRIEAEQTLIEAKDALGLAMGISYEAIDVLALPADDFLELDYQGIKTGLDYIEDYREQALGNRADYLAFMKKEEAALVLLKAAKNNLFSRLDLQLSAGYTGLTDGSNSPYFYSSLYENVPGAKVGIALGYEFPVENNSARGVLLQKMSVHRQSIIMTNNNKRTSFSNVGRSLFALKNSAEGLVRYRRAVTSYRTAVENEKKKALLGMATLLDLVNTQDRLTNAYINEVSAKVKYAQAVATLRFETGTILRVDEDGVLSVNSSDLVTIPPPSEAQ